MSEIFVHRALGRRVLTVAVINDKVKDWAAYIDAVGGHDHDKEQYEAAEKGAKLPYEIAKLIYPDIAARYQWRR